MGSKKILRCSAVVLAVVAITMAPAGATTLIRQNLEDLTAANSTIVVGEVVDVNSYWNVDANFILTDVRIAPELVVKGKVAAGELTVTLMGGTVGDTTTLIVGGAVLRPKGSYVLFLNPEDLPGTRASLTVRDHCQGAFDVRRVDGELRAISQATAHGLMPDATGESVPPGGREGLAFEPMIQNIHELAHGKGVTR